VIFQSIAVPGAAITDKSLAFSEAFKKRFGSDPSYAGYMAYDQVYYTADAVKRAGSTEADKLVDALETTDWVGTVGRTQFYGKDDAFTHSIKYGPGFVTGLMAQWQDGKQVAIWPASLAQGKIVLPPAVKAAAR
jgi:branched-chain amino acid transport system substrate-binding protein